MYSIAARRANKRVCQLQPNGMLSRGIHAYPGANGAVGTPAVASRAVSVGPAVGRDRRLSTRGGPAPDPSPTETAT